MANFDGFPPQADLVSPSYITVQNDGVWDRGGSFTVEFAREFRVRQNVSATAGVWETYQYSDFSPVTPYSLFRFGTGRTVSYNVFRVLRSQEYVVLPLEQAAYEYTDPREESINDISWLVAPGFTCFRVEQTLGFDGFVIPAPDGITLERVRQDTLIAHFSVDSSVAAGIYELAYKTWVLELFYDGEITEYNWYERKSERIFISVGFSNVFPAPRTGINREDNVWDPFPGSDGEGGEGDGMGSWDGEKYNWGSGEWATLNALSTLGGGRYNQRLVVLGHRQIYFGGD